jgi:glycosyltransferase involved in cell wall biosynthesis
LENTKEWLSAEKIEIIYNGIQVEQIEEAPIETDIRQEFGIADSTTVIANVGRLSEQKGHCYLIEAVQLLAQERDDFKVLVVGKGELEEEIKAQVKKLGLEDHIIFTGFRTDVYSIMKQIDFLLHTALWEGFGFVVAEAMAAGKPVVSTDVSNISEIMIDGQTGYLAKPKNPEDIANKTLKMIDPSKEKRNQMGEQGRKIVKDNFSFSAKIEQLIRSFLKD